MELILERMITLRPKAVVVDSINTVYLEEVTSSAGGVVQVGAGGGWCRGAHRGAVVVRVQAEEPFWGEGGGGGGEKPGGGIGTQVFSPPIYMYVNPPPPIALPDRLVWGHASLPCSLNVPPRCACLMLRPTHTRPR